ncbi:MAG: glycoside hydrolase family 127 protein [Prevotella sp.]|nr:glycoside hydrolase family 127 protein [Prevotella sp.]
MKKYLSAVLIAAASMTVAMAQSGYPITPVPFTAVKVADGTFWGQRLRAAREVTVPLAFSKCESEGRYRNFVQCQHPSPDYPPSGFSFDDTDVYKTVEGASYMLMTMQDKAGRTRLINYMDSVLDIVGKAQEPDGYLYTPRTMNPWHSHQWAGDKRWLSEEVLSHELYNLGHMVDAACAHYQATRSRKFLDIAVRYADCVCREVGRKDGQACVVPGHQIAEMALARLYVLINTTPALKDLQPKAQQYLDEAKFFLDERGKTTIKNIYSQSDKPVVDQTEAWGHAVRAGYMYAGMADVAALTGDSAYLRAIDAIWKNIVERKYYLTGGVGARHSGEAFGADYELPNLTAYNETCAAIAQVYLNYRMFLLHGDAKYYDCLERTLYNGVISGMSMDGGRFFYPNPLESDGKYAFNADGNTTRQPWFGCACCPSNLCRFIPSVPGYIYAVKDDRLYVNLYMGNTATVSINGKAVSLQQTTDYPWNGDIQIKLLNSKAQGFKLMLRIPGWVRGEVVPSNLYEYAKGKYMDYSVTVNGKPLSTDTHHPTPITENGYVVIDRKWKKGDVVSLHFDIKPRLVKANPRVADDRGKLAVERGPLVYCAEDKDNVGINLRHLLISPSGNMQLSDLDIQNTECKIPSSPARQFTVKALTVPAQEVFIQDDGSVSSKPVQLRLIPYYAWNHRGASSMAVWIANRLGGLKD